MTQPFLRHGNSPFLTGERGWFASFLYSLRRAGIKLSTAPCFYIAANLGSLKLSRLDGFSLDSYNSTPAAIREPKIFYGWYIVAVGFLAQVNCAFHMSSTLSVFLKPLTEDLAVSRGLFSLLRSGEILIAGGLAPLVGPLVDRYGGRWLMTAGALFAGVGFIALSQVSAFWQFLLVRWTCVAFGGVFMCQLVVSVTISRWFVRHRGRAIATASLGQGLSKVLIPIVTAALFIWVGWRATWADLRHVHAGSGR